MLFSQRKGIKPVRSTLQYEFLDEAARNGIWGLFKVIIWKEDRPIALYDEHNRDIKNYLFNLWYSYFKWDLDKIPQDTGSAYQTIKSYFYKCEWFEAFDFIEFTLNNYYHPPENRRIIKLANNINFLFEREVIGYRLVNNIITEIVTPNEINEIEESLTSTKGEFNAVSKHLERALELMSDRSNPDYRNSIKESISAVESFCKIITNDDKATLGQSLKVIESQVSLHPALKSAFSMLYGYTSDENGIRHAMLQEPTVNFEEAKFMLTACSTFINYLKAKAIKTNIPLSTE